MKCEKEEKSTRDKRVMYVLTQFILRLNAYELNIFVGIVRLN